MGPVAKNLDNLLRLPTGCGEQTMTSFAPDVFVYNYLENTNQLTTEVKEKALMYMQKGIPFINIYAYKYTFYLC